MTRSGGPHRADGVADPPVIDTSTAHPARMYDWWLGGRHNFAADRALGQAVIDAVPATRMMARANRRFLERAVRYLVREAGIRQFLDIGAGIPVPPNVHEIADELAPDCRVVYVDNDPIVLAHSRALATEADAGRVAYLHADLRSPEEIVTNPTVAATLDLTRPVGLLLVGILMLLRDVDDPWGKAGVLMDAVPAGSHVALTHPGLDFNPQAMAGAVAVATEGRLTLVPRTRAKVEQFFRDWEVVEPGVVPVLAWRPEDRPPADPNAAYYWAGVARKPGGSGSPATGWQPS